MGDWASVDSRCRYCGNMSEIVLNPEYPYITDMNFRTCIGLLAVPAMVLSIPSCGERKREQARECHTLYVEYCKTWCSLNESNAKETAEKLDSLLTRCHAFFSEFEFSSVKYLPKWERDMVMDSINQHTERLFSIDEALIDRLYSEKPGLKDKVDAFDEMIFKRLEVIKF